MTSEDVAEMVVGLRCNDECIEVAILLPFFDRIWVCEPEMIERGESFIELPGEIEQVTSLGRELFECIVATGLADECQLEASSQTVEIMLFENSNGLVNVAIHPSEQRVVLLDDVMAIVHAVQDFAAKIPPARSSKGTGMSTSDAFGFVAEVDVSAEEVDRITAHATAIVEAELGEYHQGAFFGVKSRGVSGDESTYKYAAIIRCTDPDLKAKWGEEYQEKLADASTRITNEVPGVNHVVYEPVFNR